MKKNIVIITAGPNALFQQWEDYSNYNFDLAIIKWKDCELTNTENAIFCETIAGYKFHIINEFSKLYNLSGYEYIYILDDDCLTTPADINATFDFCKQNNLDLSQPALTLDSFGSHPPTFRLSGSTMHITDTVEIMCSIFSQCAWPDCSEHFGKMPLGLGYGMEGYWTGILDSKSGVTKFGGKVAVIDKYPVKHTRPVSGPSDFARRGIDPNDDSRYFIKLGYGGWTFKTIEVIT